MQAAPDDDGVLILHAVRPGFGGSVASRIAGGSIDGGRSRRSQSVTADTARIPAGTRSCLSGLAILEESNAGVGSSWLPGSVQNPRPQQPPQQPLLQRRRSSIALTPTIQREIAAPSSHIAADQLLRAVQSVEVLESQEEWNLVTRQNGATFWLSRRTGQFKSHAPNSVYRAQASEIKKLLERISQLEKELTFTQARLENWKAEQMQMKTEDPRPDLLEKDAQLMRLNHSLERLKSELNQRDELIKLKETELTRRNKEIQKLGEKIQRVDALMAELLDAQEGKNKLEQQLREKDFELGQTQRQLHVLVAEKSEAVEAEHTNRLRCDNLMEQVRIEVERTAALEERLSDLEKASEARVRLEAEVERLAKEARDAEFLVASARRVQRSQSEQLANTSAELQQLRAECKAATAATEARELAARCELKEALAASDRHRRAAVGLRALLLELRRQVPGSGTWIDSYFASGDRSGGSGGINSGGVNRIGRVGRLLNDRSSCTVPQMASMVVASVDNAEVLEAVDKTIDAAEGSATAGKMEETPRSTQNSRMTGSDRIEGSTSTNGGGVGSSSRASRQLRERVAALYIHLGDRVTVRMAGSRTAEAVVKYIGAQPGGDGRDRRGGGARYGLRLLGKEVALVAAADAMEAAQFRSDLLAPAKQIECVYNQKANSFRQLDELVSDYLRMSQRS